MVIASDVDPIELVVWLPALCRKMGVPYVIVNNKGRLGSLVHQKKATAVALTAVKAEDNAALEKLVESADAHFANNVDARRKWGGGIMGLKTQRSIEKRERMIAAGAWRRGSKPRVRAWAAGGRAWWRSRVSVRTLTPPPPLSRPILPACRACQEGHALRRAGDLVTHLRWSRVGVMSPCPPPPVS